MFYRIQSDLELNRQPECLLYNETLAAFDFTQFDRTLVYILVQLELNVRHYALI